MVRKQRDKPPARKPLQMDLDDVVSRLTQGMRGGCLAAIERLNIALDGSLEQAKKDLGEQVAAVTISADEQRRVVAAIRGALAPLAVGKLTSDEAAVAVMEIAGLVGVHVGADAPAGGPDAVDTAAGKRRRRKVKPIGSPETMRASGGRRGSRKK